MSNTKINDNCFDIEQALGYFVKGEGNWIKPVSVVFVLFLVSLFLKYIFVLAPKLSLLIILFLLAISSYIMGFFINISHNRIYKPNEDIFNFNYLNKKIIFDGFKIFIVIFIYSIISAIMIKLLGIGLSNLLALVLFFICYIGVLNYTIDFKFSSFFNIKRMLELLNGRIILLLKLYGWAMVLSIAAGSAAALIGFIIGIIFHNSLLFIIIGQILLMLATMVIADLNAQFIRKALKMDKTE